MKFPERPINNEQEIKEQEINKIIRNLKVVADVLVGRDVNLIVIRGRPDVPLHFNYETRTCVISIEFLRKIGLIEFNEILFGVVHEACHFIQFLMDPEGFKRLYELIEIKAKQMVEMILSDESLKDKILNYLKDKNYISQDEDASSDKVRNFLLEFLMKAYHQLLNCLLDIQANSLVRKNLVTFQKREGEGEEDKLREIYRKLFPYEDISHLPYHQQFSYALLRNLMTEEEVVVSEQVRKDLQTEVEYLGKKMSISDLTSIVFSLESKELKATFLLSIINLYYLPIFEALLRKDIEEGRLEIIELPIDLHGEYEEIRKIIDELNRFFEDQKKPAEEKSKEIREEIFKKFSREGGFNEEEVKELYEILKSVEEIMEDMNKIWYNFLVERIISEPERTGYFNRGTYPDIYRVPIEWPRIQTSPQEAEIFKRDVLTEKREFVPRKIKICLVIDLSGSMTEEKRKAVQRIVYAVIQSLINFREEIKLNYPQFSPFNVEWKIIGFGGTGNVRELPIDKTDNEEINLQRSILDIKRLNLGGTDDAQALEIARNFFTEEDIEKIQNKDTLGIVLEITDGETATVNESTDLVYKINKLGIFCRGIQIPEFGIGIRRTEKETGEETGEETEKETGEETGEGGRKTPRADAFGKVWEKRGRRVEYLEALPKVVIELLKEAIEIKR